MRNAVLISIAICACAAAAVASDAPPSPDYSEKALLHILAQPPEPPKGRIEWRFGAVGFHVLHTDWWISFLPFRAALPGARLEDNATLPNPFALTNTSYASTSPPPPEQDRSPEVQREYQRILSFKSR